MRPDRLQKLDFKIIEHIDELFADRYSDKEIRLELLSERISQRGSNKTNTVLEYFITKMVAVLR